MHTRGTRGFAGDIQFFLDSVLHGKIFVTLKGDSARILILYFFQNITDDVHGAPAVSDDCWRIGSSLRYSNYYTACTYLAD